VIANAIGGAACGFVENNCWSSCLNPLNWGGRRPKLGKPRKSSPPESCPLPNSFSAGTLVHTEEGLKPIEEIKIGEKVLSMDENTGKTSYQLVTDLIQGERQYRLIEITLDSGKSIEATADHPFYIKGKGWNPASSLKVGQVLELHDGTVVVVKEVDTSIRRDLVYNLTVANTHNYFVGLDGVLVHNAEETTKLCIPQSPKGKGSVPSSERDSKRVWTKTEKEEVLKERGGSCDRCGKKINIDEARGHHIERHADGGQTTKDNLAILCGPCHKEVHR